MICGKHLLTGLACNKQSIKISNCSLFNFDFSLHLCFMLHSDLDKLFEIQIHNLQSVT